MSYKSRKRRDQRRRSIERIQWWIAYRKYSAEQAYKDWLKGHEKEIRDAYLNEVN